MELSEAVVKGLQSLADCNVFNLTSYAIFTKLSFISLASPRGETFLDHPELKHVDQATLKCCHSAAVTFILEGVKQNADKSTLSSCLEDLGFPSERVDTFFDHYQKHKSSLESLLSSVDTCPPSITDVSWRLEYCVKNSNAHKVNQPSFLVSFNTEQGGETSDLAFRCTTEELQDLVGKLKDAAKSVERAAQF